VVSARSFVHLREATNAVFQFHVRLEGKALGLDVEDDDVPSPCAGVGNGVFLVEADASELALEVAHVESLSGHISAYCVNGPDVDHLVVHRDDFFIGVVVETNLVCLEPGFTCFAEWRVVVSEFLDVDGAVVNAAHGGQLLVRRRKRERGNLDLVLLPTFEKDTVLEVPEVHLCFEAHLGLLPSGNETAALGDGEGRDCFVRAVKETDRFVFNVANYE